MCGIAGIIFPGVDKDQSLALLDRMLVSIAHRGPDARGTFWANGIALGHNRLSIIDLSHEADQPMHYQGNTLVFNGEIYNYLEIREQLIEKGYAFHTKSDTEVVMASYLEWGTECVKRFVGMWAFSLYDSLSQTVFVSRDRFGIKPFYYIQQRNSFSFASEIKALRSAPGFSNDVNVDQVGRGLQMGWTSYADETYFSCVKALPAAHNLTVTVSPDGVPLLSQWRYWDIETGGQDSSSFPGKAEMFRDLFSTSIALHMRADVPVATCLSGGLDSSAIVSEVQSQHPGVAYKSFSIYYDGDGEVDERPFIREVIGKYPAIDAYYKKPSDAEVAEEFHRALYHADVPATGSSFISQYFLMKLISENGIRVVLDGQGSDEYLGGYMHSYYRLIADMLRGARFSDALSLTGKVSSNLGLNSNGKLSHFGKSILTGMRSEQSLYELEYRHYYPFLLSEKPKIPPFRLADPQGTHLDKFLYNLIFTTSLPSLLQYEDRNSMAFSIESRVPFLDHRLVEFAFSLTNEDRIKGLETKRILRHALKEVLPEAIARRRDKKGFVTPGETKWMRGPLAFLGEIRYENLPFLDRKVVEGIMDRHRKGDNSISTLAWRIGTLNYWMQHFV
jgi:asparagine synthase (glutamine-hydrolysing)